MQIIIKNRLNGAADDTIEDVKVKIPELIVALWEVPQSKVRRFFAKPADKPTADHVQQVMNLGILSFKLIHFTPYYGNPISGVTLISNNRYWISLVIDEKEYFKHHAKKIGLIDQLVEAYSTPCQPPVSISILEPRPVDEVNPVYPDKPCVKADPKKETNPSLDKNKANRLNLPIHAALCVVVTAACIALGMNWLFSLLAVILSNIGVYYAQTREQTSKVQKTTDPEAPKPSSKSNTSEGPSPKLPIPDNINLLFSKNHSKEPTRPVLDASPTLTKKVAKA